MRVVVAALRAQATELQASATEAQGKSERLEAELATLRQAAEAAGEEQGGALAKLVRKTTAMVLLLTSVNTRVVRLPFDGPSTFC